MGEQDLLYYTHTCDQFPASSNPSGPKLGKFSTAKAHLGAGGGGDGVDQERLVTKMLSYSWLKLRKKIAITQWIPLVLCDKRSTACPAPLHVVHTHSSTYIAKNEVYQLCVYEAVASSKQEGGISPQFHQ